MPRNRIIYQSEALYAGPAPATGFHYGTSGLVRLGIGGDSNSPNSSLNLVKQLQRIQTANYSFNVDRTDVNQFGQLAAIDRVILTNPTVALDFSYINANLANENILGFTVVSGNADSNVSAISGFLNKTTDERNYFIRTTPEGNDAVGFSNTGNVNGVIGIGNGFITSYSTEASVGNFPTTTINVEGLNMNFQNGISGNYVPAVNPADGKTLLHFYQLPEAVENVGIGSGNAISALRPGDITLSLSNTSAGGAEVDKINIQSYTLSFDLARTPIEKLGNKFAFAKEIDFPLTVTLSIDAQVTDMQIGNLASLVADDSTTYSPSITIKSPTDANLTMAKFKLKGAKLDSQEFSSDIGANKTVTLTFSTQVGGPQDTDNGLFINGQF
jgi:hypothetical protein